MEQENDGIARWYVVHTYSGYENKVSQNLETIVENRRLQDLICEVKVPVEIVPEIKDGKEREVEHKLFPGYVLVKMVMTDESWYIVRNTRGVTGFVGSTTKPVPLSDAEVDALGVDVREAQLDYAVGDN
ncbi:MAG: transcription termination/antitermination NusG family protein, partial [Oscillospiraceae bacterium]